MGLNFGLGPNVGMGPKLSKSQKFGHNFRISTKSFFSTTCQKKLFLLKFFSRPEKSFCRAREKLFFFSTKSFLKFFFSPRLSLFSKKIFFRRSLFSAKSRKKNFPTKFFHNFFFSTKSFLKFFLTKKIFSRRTLFSWSSFFQRSFFLGNRFFDYFFFQIQEFSNVHNSLNISRLFPIVCVMFKWARHLSNELSFVMYNDTRIFIDQSSSYWDNPLLDPNRRGMEIYCDGTTVFYDCLRSRSGWFHMITGCPSFLYHYFPASAMHFRHFQLFSFPSIWPWFLLRLCSFSTCVHNFLTFGQEPILSNMEKKYFTRVHVSCVDTYEIPKTWCPSLKCRVFWEFFEIKKLKFSILIFFQVNLVIFHRIRYMG